MTFEEELDEDLPINGGGFVNNIGFDINGSGFEVKDDIEFLKPTTNEGRVVVVVELAIKSVEEFSGGCWMLMIGGGWFIAVGGGCVNVGGIEVVGGWEGGKEGGGWFIWKFGGGILKFGGGFEYACCGRIWGFELLKKDNAN